jgi:hypothetical protein
MTKPISTRVHGAIDYLWAAASAALARRLDGAGATSRLLDTAGAAATASSMVTKYEWGAVPLMPMRGHLAADLALCSVMVASPLFLPPAERRYAAIPVILGAMGIVVSLLTDPRPSLE